MAEPADPQRKGPLIEVLAVGDLLERSAHRVVTPNEGMAVTLLQITSAIAEAVTPDAVYAAIVDHLAAALSASSCGLWLRDGKSLRLVRQVGYSPRSEAAVLEIALDQQPGMPFLDAFRQARPVHFSSQRAFLEAYPHARPVATPGRSYRVTCFPLVADGAPFGVMALTFDEERDVTSGEQSLLLLVARYATNALERLRLHREADQARHRAEQLYRFANAVVEAETLEAVFEAALSTITDALGARRASILLFDDDHVMKFRAWRGLSEAYRAAVEGHSPWKHDEKAPSAVLVEDSRHDPAWSAYAPLFEREGIGALAFIPLVTRGKLLGKFMVYYDEPRVFAANELEVARAIANHLASMIARFRSVADLERTIRDNELFAGVLAHDLRNPLSAILTAAQLALMYNEGAGDRSTKPLSRIVSSTERMSNMITQLLDFTRARVGGGIEIRRCTTSLLDIADQAVAELELSHPSRRFDVMAVGDLDGNWDPDRLLQVVSNLVGNACQHGAAESPISIGIDGHASDVVILSVHNRGVIPPALMPRIFEPFRGQERHHGSTRGLGLGLYIVREIVRAHHGTVEVRSTEDEDGTTFSVLLPRT